jgi:putative membrane protein insertion efficiency factor
MMVKARGKSTSCLLLPSQWLSFALLDKTISQLLITLIHIYRYTLSPIWGRHCRFEPTCSLYSIEAIKIHGCLKGAWLMMRRLLCCHPWHSGGIDHVPHLNDKKRSK